MPFSTKSKTVKGAKFARDLCLSCLKIETQLSCAKNGKKVAAKAEQK